MEPGQTADRLRHAWASVLGYEEASKAARRTFLSLVDQYLQGSWTQAQIARELGISRQRLNDMRRER